MPRILYPALFLPTPGGGAFDPAVKPASFTLSNSNLTAASLTGNGTNLVRTTSSKSGGRVYLEFRLNTVGATTGVGIVTRNDPSNGFPAFDGLKEGITILPGTNQSLKYAANQLLSVSGAGGINSVAGEFVSIALDIGAGLIWYTTATMRTQATPWNNLASSDPGTGVGGISIPNLTSGLPYFAFFGDQNAGTSSVTINLGATAFNQAVPTGFTAWDSTASEEIFGDKWGQPISQPVLRRDPASFARVVSLVGPIAPIGIIPAPPLDGWVQPPSQPTRLIPQRLAASGVIPSPAPAGAGVEQIFVDKWGQPPSQPTLRLNPSGTAQSASGPIPSPAPGAPETVTADRWVQPPSQPVLRLNPRGAAQSASGPIPSPAPGAPETVTLDRWGQPPSQPYPAPRRLTSAVDASDGPIGPAAPVTTETITLDKWAQPTSQPVQRIPRRLAADGPIPSPAPGVPETVTADRWGQPPSQPVLRLNPSGTAQSAAGSIPSPAPGAPESVTLDRWGQPPSQPTLRVPQRLATGPVGFTAPAPTETITLDKWYQPPSQPVLPRDPSAAAKTASGAITPPTQRTTWNPSDKSATITLSNANLTATSATAVAQSVRSTTAKSSGKIYWEITLSTTTTNIAVGLASFAAQLNAAGGLGSTVDSMGFYPVSPAQQAFVNSSPVGLGGASADSNGDVVSFAINFNTSPPTAFIGTPVMRAASTPWNNSATDNPSTNTGGIVLTGLVGTAFYAAFNEIDSGGVVVGNFGATAYNQAVPTGYSSWDSPPTQAGVESITLDKWFQPASQPTLRIPQRLAASGPIPSPAPGAPETVSADRWFQPTSQPTIRIPQRLAADGVVAPLLPIVSEIVLVDKWAQPTNQPVQRIPRRLAADGAIGSPAPVVPESIFVDKWAQPTNQPVLPITRQPAILSGVVQTFRTIVPEVVTMDKWYRQAVIVPGRRVSYHAALQAGAVFQGVVLGGTNRPTKRVQIHWID